jgi:ribosomal protein S18 acetylase RimI-like enzyme
VPNYPHVTIRPIRADEYAAVCRVWQAVGLSARLTGRDAEAEFRKQLAHFPTSYLAAEHDGRLVGVILGTHDQRKGWISHLAVIREYRRQGIARRLIEACEQALYAQGIGIIAALVETGNAASAKFFADAGYVTDVPVHYFRKRTRPDI